MDTAVGVVDDAARAPDDGNPYAGHGRRAAWIGVAVAVAVFWLLATSGQPWHLFDRGPFTADFYDAQAHALLSGHLDVPADVARLEGFDVDGRTYLYFGLGPALLRLPVALLGSGLDGRLTVVSMLVAVAVLGLAAARLLVRARVAVGGRQPRPLVVGLFAGGVALASPVLFLASRGVVYHEAELWGAAAGLAGLDLALSWWARPSRARLVGLAALAAFAFACRPTSGSAPTIALGLFVLVLLFRRSWRLAAEAAVAAAVAGLAYVAVNLARFGTLLSVPWDAQQYSSFDAARQAALAANDGTLQGLKFVPTTMWHYLSPLPTSVDVGRLFPFVGWGRPARVVGGATFDTIDRSSSLLVAAPLLVVLAVVGLVWVVRRDRSQGWRVIGAAALAGTAGTFAIGFIAQRYLVDLVPPLVVLAAPGIWVTWGWLTGRSPAWRRGLLAVGAAVVVVGLLGQVALAVRARYFYIVPTDDDRLALLDTQYRIDDRLFGGAPPDVVRADGALPDPVDGRVAILDGCAGLYRGDGVRWAGVEWEAGGGRRLVLEPDAGTADRLGSEPVTVATGDGWAIVAEPAGGGRVSVVYENALGQERSRPFDPTGKAFDVVADPATTQVIVRVGGTTVLSAFYGPAGGISPGSGWSPRPGDAPLCASLEARLPPSG